MQARPRAASLDQLAAFMRRLFTKSVCYFLSAFESVHDKAYLSVSFKSRLFTPYNTDTYKYTYKLY